jgi:hypothetical protein
MKNNQNNPLLAPLIRIALEAPEEAKLRHMADTSNYVEVPIDRNGERLNAFVIVNTGRAIDGGIQLCAAFWRERCTADDVGVYCHVYGSQHAQTSEQFDVHDSILGCMALPLASYVPDVDASVEFQRSYTANLYDIFKRLKN